MTSLEAPLVLSLQALARSPEGWEPLRAGIQMRPIYGTDGVGPRAALLRYEPGATLPAHSHPGYEHILVLEGEQSDERGDYGAGTLVVNPPGTGHQVRSPKGCLVLAIWALPVQF